MWTVSLEVREDGLLFTGFELMMVFQTWRYCHSRGYSYITPGLVPEKLEEREQLVDGVLQRSSRKNPVDLRGNGDNSAVNQSSEVSGATVADRLFLMMWPSSSTMRFQWVE